MPGSISNFPARKSNRPREPVDSKRTAFPGQREVRQGTIAGFNLEAGVSVGEQFCFGPAERGGAIFDARRARNPGVMHGVRDLDQGNLLQRASAATGRGIDREIHLPFAGVLSPQHFGAQLRKLKAALLEFDLG